MNRSMGIAEESSSSRYAFLYYAVGLIRADAGKENLHPKEFTLGIRTPDAIFSEETVLCRRSHRSTKIDDAHI